MAKPEVDSEAVAAALDYLEDEAPVLVLRLDGHFTITAANAHARRVLGEVIGLPLAQVVENFARELDPGSLLQDGSTPRPLVFSQADRLPETYLMRFIRTREGIVAFGHIDVDELTALRTELLALNRRVNDAARSQHMANAQLRELGRMKDQFLGMAAHDLAHPLNTIVNYAEFLLGCSAVSTGDTTRSHVATILRTAGEMQRLVDDFLDVAMIESGRLRLSPDPTTVEALFGSAAEELRLVVERHGVRLTVDAPPEPVRAAVDPAKVRQVLVNLVANAARHSPPGGAVRLAAAWDGPDLVLSVTDEGGGISVEQQRLLFQPFAAVAQQRDTSERHAGLGLAIARTIIEAHGGTIGIDSRPGAGCVVRIRLPGVARGD